MRRPSLSVCCHAYGSGPRIAAMLGQLRAVADEIFIAADARTTEHDLAAYASVADRVLRYEFRGGSRDAAWLHDQCGGDWILWVAGDEVASPALIEQLPELIADRGVLQYWLPTGWLFPDSAHFLAAEPWWPDFHNRLVRNDGTLRFSGIQHRGAEPAYPARYIEAPLYHLDLILTDENERTAKVHRYEANRPGLKGEDGRPLNETLYLPEREGGDPSQPIPARDRRAVAEVLGARGRGLPPGHPDPPPSTGVVSRAEVERHWALRPLSRRAYRASLIPVSPRVRAAAGGHRSVYVRVQNDGDEHWPWGLSQHPMIRLGHRLHGEDGALLEDDTARSPLPTALAPGQWTVVPVAVVVPRAPGTYRVVVELVHEDVCWFGHPAVVELDVYPTRITRDAESGARAAMPTR